VSGECGRREGPGAEGRGFRVLVVDDAEGIRSYLASLLELRGYEVDTAEDGRRALVLLEGGAAPDVVLLDVMMPGPGGMETLRQIRELDAELPVVMLSVVGKASAIVEAMNQGASDYVNKPFEEEELLLTLQKVLEKRALQKERDELLAALPGEGATFASPAMAGIREVIDRIRDTDVTVLVQGESGVGKEVVARAIHESSPRADRPLVKVNCAALPGELLESELFGYEKGAFTGATTRKPGRFELAHRGTLFLDEIGEMSFGLQAKLLHVLQDGRFTRLGGNREVRADVRVICATNRELREMVAAGRFREDLYYRLDVVNIRIPPLRERREEIPDLARLFLARAAARYGRPAREPGPRLLGAFERYAFPGNVRELENMMKRVVVLESEDSILEEMERAEQGGDPAGTLAELIERVEATAGEIPLREVGRRVAEEAERGAISRVLAHTNWNRKRAARLLGVSYKTLLHKIRQIGLEPD